VLSLGFTTLEKSFRDLGWKKIDRLHRSIAFKCDLLILSLRSQNDFRASWTLYPHIGLVSSIVYYIYFEIFNETIRTSHIA